MQRRSARGRRFCGSCHSAAVLCGGGAGAGSGFGARMPSATRSSGRGWASITFSVCSMRRYMDWVASVRSMAVPFFPSPRRGEGAEPRSGEAGEGMCGDVLAARFLAPEGSSGSPCEPRIRPAVPVFTGTRGMERRSAQPSARDAPEAFALGARALRALHRGDFGPRAALFVRWPPLGRRSVSELLAPAPSGRERSPGASRVRGCEPRPRAPQPIEVGLARLRSPYGPLHQPNASGRRPSRAGPGRNLREVCRAGINSERKYDQIPRQIVAGSSPSATGES